MSLPSPLNPVQPDRRQTTNEERQTLALEMIADQLTIMRDHLERYCLTFPNSAEGNSFTAEVSAETTDDYPNTNIEGSILRGTIETFTVGNYRYTKLSDAMAEVSRSNMTIHQKTKHMLNRKLPR